MIGSGMPMSQSNAPFPKDMAASFDVSVKEQRRWISLVPSGPENRYVLATGLGRPALAAVDFLTPLPA
jgi:hypothetical protein